MSDGRNLWIGVLLGMLLTGGLMFALYQQSGLVSAKQESSGKRDGALPEVSEVFAPAKPGGGEAEESTLPAASTELVDKLPAELDLSPEELSELSIAERAQYEAMLKSYLEVRAQVLALDQERADLKQRMDSMFEQNEVMEQEIERMRAVLQQMPAKDE